MFQRSPVEPIEIMLDRPATAAPSSQATICSLRRTNEHGPTTPSPRSPSRPQDHAVDAFDNVPLNRPQQALLTAQHTSYDPAACSPGNDCLPTPHRRGHTKALSTSFLDNCRPLVDRATSSLSAFQNQPRAEPSSPRKSFASFIPSRPDPATVPEEQRHRSSVIGDWFNSLSSPPRHDDSESDIGSDSDLDSDDDAMDSNNPGFTSRTTGSVGRAKSVKSLKRTSTHANTQNTSVFASWFNRNKGDARKHDLNMPQDPLSVMDIEAALFPNGQPETLDPAAFHALHKASTALLEQFQQSYKAMHLCMQDTRLEEDGLREEKKQAEVHAQNLQMQIENLKAESEKRDMETKVLREALERECQLRADEEESRVASLRAMKACKCNRKSTASSTSEPNGVLSDRDSGFESEGETITENASRPTSMLSESELPDLDSNPSTAPTSAPSPVEPSKPAPLKRQSTFGTAFQKKRNSQRGSILPVVLTGAGKMSDVNNGQMDVWRENRELRERVENLERTVDETLGLVGGL